MDKNEKFNRFGSVCAEEKQKILDGKESENSLKSSRLSYCLFDKYCTEKNLVFDINSVSKGDLDAIQSYLSIADTLYSGLSAVSQVPPLTNSLKITSI